MIPIRDVRKSFTSPHVTRMLIIINVIVFAAALLPDLSKPYFLGELLGVLEPPAESSLYKATLSLGMIPAEVLDGQRLYTLITSMFMHANLIHLGGNMLFLYVFGNNVEDAFGHFRFFLFYFVAGLFATSADIGSLLFFGNVQGLGVVTIGASGAISGVLGAYLLLYPTARILTLVFFGWVLLLPIPAVIFLLYWFLLQLLNGVLAPSLGGVAYWAHIGGFIVGLFFGAFWRGRRRKREL